MDCETVGRCREQGEFLGRGSDFPELWKNGTRSCTWSTPTGPTQATCGKESARGVTSAEFQLVTCGEEGRGDARRTGGAAKMQNVSSVAPSLLPPSAPTEFLRVTLFPKETCVSSYSSARRFRSVRRTSVTDFFSRRGVSECERRARRDRDTGGGGRGRRQGVTSLSMKVEW